ncbi:MAG: PEP/pyruvate-binding domain-containing protein [Candidatus Nanohalobium sp.]
MVQWKGNVQREEAGEKAANLESLENFEVPNFFVLTKSEVEDFLESRDPQRIANQKIPEDLVEKVKSAYQDIGMASEVRNASGQARNLVGNQRESQRVSVRISSSENLAEYKLNVGASGLEEALRKVLSSYYRENSDTPAIIFQKMIEPEYTGAVIKNYTRRHSLVEIVEGLGHSLEEGITVPEFYLLNDASVQDTRVPDKQVKVTRNPMNGQRRTRTISNSSPTFQNSEIEDLAKKASREGLSIKFVYKRGSFYIVDAFKTEPINVESDLKALKVSEGEIEGREGEDYILSDETRRADRPLVAKKGGYTTTDSQQMRASGLPAVVSLENEDRIRAGSSSRQQKRRQRGRREDEGNVSEVSDASKEVSFSGVAATEVRSIDQFPGLSENPFSYQDSEQEFADSCEEILVEDPDLVDGRDIEDAALLRCLEVVENVRVLAIRSVSEEVLRAVVENGVEVVAVPDGSVEQVSQRILRKEKRFIMENLRN